MNVFLCSVSLQVERAWRHCSAENSNMQSSAFSLVSFSSFIVLLLGISLYTQEQGLSQIFSTLSHRAGLCRPDSESLHPFLPHTASWNTWFHPQRAAVPRPDPPRERRKGWNILYHLGGYGPWIEKVDGTASTIGQGDAVAPPVGCVVDQIHVVRSSCLQLN